jgi:toxin ParE1/3/4
MRLAYSAEAVEDLIRLRSFIAEHDPAAATRVGAELVARIDHLRKFPALGKMVTSAPDPEVMRDAILGNYVVRYAILPSSVIILRLWHHAARRDADIQGGSVDAAAGT